MGQNIGYKTEPYSFLPRSAFVNENPEIFLGFLIERQNNTQLDFLQTFRELSFNNFFFLLGGQMGEDIFEMDPSLEDYQNSQFDSAKGGFWKTF